MEQYSRTNVYWLTWGERTGARVAVVSGARRADPTLYNTVESVLAREYYDTVHTENDNIISWLGNIQDIPPEELTSQPTDPESEADNWYWGNVGVSELTSFTLPVVSPAPGGAAQLTVSLMGLSSIDSMDLDHTVELFINDEPVSEKNIIRWDGQRPVIFTTDTFSTDLLNHGKNTLTLQTPSEFSDRSALNWVDVSYLRGYTALDNIITFKNNPRFFGTTIEYPVSGFSSTLVDVWDITHFRLFKDVVIEEGNGKLRGTNTVVFQDSISSHTEYFVQSTEKRIIPDNIYLDKLIFITEFIGHTTCAMLLI